MSKQWGALCRFKPHALHIWKGGNARGSIACLFDPVGNEPFSWFESGNQTFHGVFDVKYEVCIYTQQCNGTEFFS